jgi:diguanylate cyclase (GGDEF)-like protein/PAS domain S-box-containing protein
MADGDAAAAALQPVPVQGIGEDLRSVAMEAAPDGILLVDRSGRILLANPAMQAMSGYGAHELLGNPLQMLLPAEAHAAHGPQLQSYFDRPARRPMGQGRDLWLLRKDGQRLSVDIALGHSPHGGGVAVAFVRDLSQLRQMEACMHYHATHDTLTGLLNRWQFGLQMEQAISQAQAGTGPASFALLLLDLDDFKAINDGYGHGVGDQVLKEVARRLQAALGRSATLARMGGDEFTVLLHPCGGEAALRPRIDALLQELCRPCAVGHFSLNFGASVGAAFYPQDAGDAATLMRYADMAMYEAKQRGRASYARYASAMGEAMAEKVLLHERLKRALDRGLLSLHFQPQVQVSGGQVQGVEALLRWNDEQMGWVSPERFVPVAESTGLILALGEWVIDAACRQAGDWLRAGRPAAAPHGQPGPAWRAAAPAGAGGHRIGRHDRSAAGARTAGQPAGGRRVRGAGRLRHRLFLAGPPARPAHLAREDRPHLHRPHAGQPGRCQDRQGRDRAGPHAGPAGGGRGRGNGRAAAPAAHPGLRYLPGLAVRARHAGRADSGAAAKACGGGIGAVSG